LKDLLFLAHRIPYPPNKGDKIRSLHLLRHLSGRFRVHLGAFIDDDEDWQYVDDVNALCASSCILPLRPAVAKLRSLFGLVSAEPLSVRYYRSRAMRDWVTKVMRESRIRNVVVFSSAMAQFVPASIEGLKVMDFVDADSEKWRQYASTRHWPFNWIYARESRYLLRYDRAIAAQFDRSFFVSEAEAALFKNLAPESRGKIDCLGNGVDTEYFSPDREYPDPYGNEGPVLVFTGAMDYWPNVDAVSFFTARVFPLIRAKILNARFYIVGSRPATAVKALQKTAGVVVTGRVNDIRPFLHHAALSVAPLRIARGVQNKVLEALAMNKPVLATPPAMEGILRSAEADILVAENPEDLAGQAVQVLHRGDNKNARANRELILRNYSWSRNLQKLDTILRA
jgi:sugar transferase (PEP-CTERM/EpsH1 system associated)